MLEEIWNLITANIFTTTSARGWYPVLCRVCNDHGKKGLRAGFKKDTNTIGYNCFNCPAKFKLTEEGGLSNGAYNILMEFGIPKDELDKIRFNDRTSKLDISDKISSEEISEDRRDDSPKIVPINIPNYFTYLNRLREDDVFFQVAKQHLNNERKINVGDYPFLICTDETLNKDGLLLKMPFLERWIGRLIIPIFYNGNIVHYLGYDLSNSRKQKYLNSSNENQGVMYGMERINSHNNDTPLFIVEGFFDAFHIDGVAVFTNTISDHQMYFLRKSNRRIVVIPDRGDPSSQMGEQAIKEGWEISTPDFGSSSDVGEAIKRFGKPYALRAIYNGIQRNEAMARMALRIYKG